MNLAYCKSKNDGDFRSPCYLPIPNPVSPEFNLPAESNDCSYVLPNVNVELSIFEYNDVVPSNTVLFGFTPINFVDSTPPNFELNPSA